VLWWSSDQLIITSLTNSVSYSLEWRLQLLFEFSNHLQQLTSPSSVTFIDQKYLVINRARNGKLFYIYNNIRVEANYTD